MFLSYPSIDFGYQSCKPRNVHSLPWSWPIHSNGRQLAMKDNTSASWTAQLKRTLAKYGLPSASEILETQPRKQYWGQLVKDAILRHWTDKLQDEAQQMSTLAYLKLDASDLQTISHLMSEAMTGQPMKP